VNPLDKRFPQDWTRTPWIVASAQEPELLVSEDPVSIGALGQVSLMR
jgi:hypothetical protein